MAGKKFLIRENELLYFSEKEGFLTIPKTQHNYKEILSYLISDEFDERVFLEMAKDREQNIEKVSGGKFKKTEDGKVKLGENITVPQEILNKINEMKSQGYEWRHYENFWKRCLKNPNPKSVEMLFSFLQKQNLTICKDGCFLAYKGVTSDLMDIHTNSIDNSPGQIVKMPREQVTFDPHSACHVGLHCGALEYAIGFGPVVVLVKVDPMNVVSVPYDCDAQKIRVCEYRVEKIYQGRVPLPTAVVNQKCNQVKANNYRKGGWTIDEVRLLKKLCTAIKKPSWKEIGNRIMRSAEACRKKWETIR